MSGLTEFARLPTSGARAVEHFEVDGRHHLAIAQLALDAEGAPRGMNGGDSTNATVLVLRCPTAPGEGFEEVQRLPVPGGEDAEFFRIGERAFLATASIRTGAGPYDYARPQRIFEWVDGRFTPFQDVDGYAAKQWRHFRVGERHFLALAQGIALPGHEAATLPSRIFEWDGERFTPFQDVDSAWGYNWHAFALDGEHYLAHADHAAPSRLLRWTGERFTEVQVLTEEHGRAFAHFTRDGSTYLAVARLLGPSRLLRWTGDRFVEHQELPDLGGRELAVVERGDDLHLLRVNFITGTPQQPVTELDSHVYRWHDGRLRLEHRFPTGGGTDLATWTTPGTGPLVAVSNSLTPDLRFRTDTVVYQFTS